MTRGSNYATLNKIEKRSDEESTRERVLQRIFRETAKMRQLRGRERRQGEDGFRAVHRTAAEGRITVFCVVRLQQVRLL